MTSQQPRDVTDLGVWPALGLALISFAVHRYVEPAAYTGGPGPTIPDWLAVSVWIGAGLVLLVVPPVATYRELRAARRDLKRHGVADLHDGGEQ